MTVAAAGASDTGPRPPRFRSLPIVFAAALLFVLLLALGTWQVERLAWKRALIAQVDARIHAPPRPAPGPAAWNGIVAAGSGAAYLHVRLSGRYLPGRSVRTQAATVLGPGSWLMTPFLTDRGFTVLVNRGFVPPDWRERAASAGTATVTGLLRVTEPRGGFLRRNDPAAGRWYSRDVAAIARATRLGPVAPYFVDAAADARAPAAPPVGGLTVVAFPNNHLVYAITWYALAAMVAGGWFVSRRHGRERRA